MRLVRVSLQAFIYIIFTAMTFAVSEVRESKYFYFQVAIEFVMLLSLLLFWTASKRKLYINRKLVSLLFVYLLPEVLLHIWGTIQGIRAATGYFTPTENFSIYFPILIAFCTVILFGEKAMDYTVVAFTIGVVLKSFFTILTNGMAGWDVVFMPTLEADFPLEFSDPVLALSYVFLYMYIRKKHERLKNNPGILFILILFFLLGRKRIILLSTFAAIIWFFFAQKIRDPQKKRFFCFLTSVGMAVVAFVYLAMLSGAGDFYSLIDSLGINLSGRDYFYRAMAQWYDFSPSFLGIGKNVTFALMQNEYSYFGIKAIHNDFLKIFIENGFLAFVFWELYIFLYMPYIERRYSEESDLPIFVAVNTAMFVLYLSDNTNTYFICRLFYTLIPMTYVCKARLRKLQTELIKNE